MYSILVVINDKYFDLCKIFINSIYKNCDLTKINSIIIGDIGISNKNKEYFQNYNLTKIVSFFSDINTNNGGFTHSNEWKKSVTFKTKFLLDQIINLEDSLILIDVDCVILEDFYDLINKKYDIQISKREIPSPRPDLNLMMEYIAAFVIINSNNKNVLDFLNDWIHNMQILEKKKVALGHETPALCLTIKKFKSKNMVGELDERIVECVNNYYKNLTKLFI